MGKTDMGGPQAPLTPAESIKGMREVIARLAAKDTGTYWNYDGTRMQW